MLRLSVFDRLELSDYSANRHPVRRKVGSRYRRALLAGTALAGAALLPSVAQAQSVWGGNGSTTTTTDYNLGTNWSNPPAGAPPVAAGQSAIFDATGSSTIVVTGVAA